MKTQICGLINGEKNVIRDLSASKYAECPAGTSAEFLEIYKFETAFIFRVNADMTAEALIFARKSPGAMWRTRKYEYIDESFITIL